jgi:cytoskeleton protein RodZ
VSFGSDLQLERERRGVPLEDIAEGTKFSVRHLRALETDDLGAMPGGVFNRGMLRSYCRYLDLPEDEWLGRFARIEDSGAERDYAVFAENVKRSRAGGAPNVRRRWLLVILLLVVLGGAAWAAWRYVVKPRMQPVDTTQPADASRVSNDARRPTRG